MALDDGSGHPTPCIHWSNQQRRQQPPGATQCGRTLGDASPYVSKHHARVTCPKCIDALRVEGLVLTPTQERIATRELKDNPTRPDHYGGADNPYEAIKVIHAWDLDFDLGNVVKYVARAGKKDGAKAVEDLEKAKTYLDFAIANLGGRDV